MKNKIRFLAMMLIGILLSVNQVWGEKITLTFTSSGSYGMTTAYPSGYAGEFTTSDVTFGYYKASNTQNSSIYFLHMDKSEGRFYNKTSLGNISSIKLTFSSKAESSTIYCTVGNSEINTSVTTGSKTISQSASSVQTFSDLSGGFFNLSVSGSNAARIASIEITYSNITYTDLSSGQKSGHFQPFISPFREIVIWGFFAFFCKKVFNIRCTEGARRMHGGLLPSIQPLFHHFGTLFVTPPISHLNLSAACSPRRGGDTDEERRDSGRLSIKRSGN